MSRCTIVMVNWNGHRDTIECLESLLRLDGEDFQVVVVDNGSTDGSVQHLQRWADGEVEPQVDAEPWPRLAARRRRSPSLRVVARGSQDVTTRGPGCRITVIDAGENLGFAGANNLGMAWAAADPGCLYYWILNNDTVVHAGALSALLAHAQAHPQQAIVGATLLYYDDPDVVQGLGGWLKSNRALGGHIGHGLPAASLPSGAQVEAELAYVMGASMFVRRGVVDVIGGMSEDYFLYFEELDWARRMPPGWRLGACLEALVFHKEGGSIGTSSRTRPSDTSIYYLNASTLRFYWKHERRHVPVAVARALYNMGGYLKRGDLAAVRVLGRAFVDVMSGRLRRGGYGSAEFIRSSRFG